MKTRSNINVMFRLVGIVKPLFLIMMVAIICGVLGYFCALFIPILAGYGVVSIIYGNKEIITLIIVIGIIAIMRGVLHYVEQYCNHFIAFKLLALIRDKVFTSLRKLAPSKLDVKDKGDLVSLITSDIELLEVFYAHTISPICIAFITSSIVVCFIGNFHFLLGIVAFIAHFILGVVIPLYIAKKSKISGEKHRKNVGELNTFFLDSLRGLKETLQYNVGLNRKKNIIELSENAEKSNLEIKKQTAITNSLSSFIILIFLIIMLVTAFYLNMENIIDFKATIISILMLSASFGAVSSLANLGAGLTQTIASGNRVLDILDETPQVQDVENGIDTKFNNAKVNNITFSYEEQDILKDFSLDIEKNKILGISGKSGSGKSTILKLLMRFYDVKNGEVKISDNNIKDINTKNLRDMQSFVTQETHIFHDTIENNIKIANINASEEDVISASKKASLHEFVSSLPLGYKTIIGELGSTISGGEKQRIGIARAFLHKADLILLDEPTSNLDSLNEGVILKSIKKSDKTFVLVSHRISTMKIANTVINMKTERQS